jgi:hypothetical protein
MQLPSEIIFPRSAGSDIVCAATCFFPFLRDLHLFKRKLLILRIEYFLRFLSHSHCILHFVHYKLLPKEKVFASIKT